jgi:MSHA pilin protein MshA
MYKRRVGFTLIELIIVIVILGIMSIVAIPKYFDLQVQAKAAAEKGVVGGVRAGIATFYGNSCAGGTCAYPATLDATTTGVCSVANACFASVLAQAITDPTWAKTATGYSGPTGTVYIYTVGTGTFQ